MTNPTIAAGALVLAIGVADSVNPSTVAPAIALAMQRDGARRATAFTIGVAGVSLLAGAALVSGPGQALMAAIPHPDPEVKEFVEAGLGALLLVLAATAWLCRHRIARSLSGSGDRRTRGAGVAAAFGLGAGIMAVELPTAFPYFGAIAAIVGSRASLLAQLLLVVLFNVAFVLPLLAIVAVRLVAGERAVGPLERFRKWLAGHAGALLTTVLAAGGVALLAFGLGAG
jgi:cytochrome c biogenesis protein CcdA